MSRPSQSAVHSIILASGTLGGPNSFTMRLELFSQPVGAEMDFKSMKPMTSGAAT